MNDWVSIVPMSGTGNYTATISFDEYTGLTSRQVTVKCKSKIGPSHTSLVFTQKNLQYNQIFYTSTDGNIVTPNRDAFGTNVNVVSNIYENGIGIITLDGNASYVGREAFYGCTTLKTIYLPYTVKLYGLLAFAFYGCTNLIEINLPDTDEVFPIGQEAFNFCSSIPSIKLPLNSSISNPSLFRGCTSLPIQNNIRYSSLDISDNIYLIEAEDNTLSSYTIMEGIRWIGYYSFYENTYLQEITIPNSVVEIGNSAFYQNTALSSITFSNTLKRIRARAFFQCVSLRTITLPASIEEISSEVFRKCTYLKNLYYEGTMAQWNNISLVSNWNQETQISVVHCTDGDITL